MLSDKPCSCGGDNENCYKCFGSGFIGIDPPAPRPGMPVYTVQPLGAKGIHKSKVYKVRQDKLTRTPESELGPPIKYTQPKPKPRATCPECGRQLNKTKLPGHLRRVHGKPPPPAIRSVSSDGKHVWTAGSATLETTNSSHTNVSHPEGPQNPVKHKWTESSLDGSRDYYDNYREDGNRLGSHPSHDDYGDESGA